MWQDLMVRFPVRRRLAVTGTAGCGKTVFLVSLINHLDYFEHDRFPLGKKTEMRIQKFRTNWAADRGYEFFPYEKYRAQMLAGQDNSWPDKTTDTCLFRCTFWRTDWRRPVALDILDFPGERMADAPMVTSPDYKAWSQWILAQFHRVDTAGQAVEYRAALASETVDRQRLLAAYKRTLVRLTGGFHVLASPSTFLVDRSGRRLNGESLEAILAAAVERCCGLPGEHGGPPREFVPLPEDVRSREPDLAREFEAHFEAYRREVAAPLFDWINTCDRLAVMVDIPGILNAGVGRLNDQRRLLDALCEGLKGRSWPWRCMFPAVHKVAFVATKADLVHPTDHDRLKDLLKGLVSHAMDRLDPRIRSGLFVVSACVATSPGNVSEGQGNRLLKGRLYDNPQRAIEEYEVSAPPERWPGRFHKGDYSFPIVAPPELWDEGQPPEHLNLEKVAKFLLD